MKSIGIYLGYEVGKDSKGFFFARKGSKRIFANSLNKMKLDIQFELEKESSKNILTSADK